MQRGFSAAGKLPVCSGDSLSGRDSSPTPNIRFVSAYFHSFAAGRLFLLHMDFPALPPSELHCLAAPLWGFHLHVTGIRSYFQIHYRLLTAVGNQFEESITNVLFENVSS